MQLATNVWRPRYFLRIRFAKHLSQHLRWIFGTHDDIDSIVEWKEPRKLSVSPESVTEAPWSAARQIAEPDGREADPGERRERGQLLESGQIVLYHAVGHRDVFSPLDVDFGSAAVSPVGVENLPVPKSPEVGWSVGRIVADPNELFVCRNGEGNPRTVDVVAPQQVVADDGSGWVCDGHDPLQREPFISLDV